MRVTLAILCLMLLLSPALMAAEKGVLRVSGDNSWVAFVNGEKVAEGADWQRPTVSEFKLDRGFAVIAVYVHDAEPGASGRGGFLADIILDDGTYIGTSDWQGDKKDTWPGWKADAGKPIQSRKDGWEKPDYDDSSWEEPMEYEQFGGGIWGFGAATMRQTLHDPDCLAHWIWAGPNDQADDVYFRYVIGEKVGVDPSRKLATEWGAIKSKRSYSP